LNDRPPHSGRPLNPLLKMAALAGVQPTVRLHIRRGDDINATDDKGRSPLILAASRGHTEICRILLEAGADPRAFDDEGNDAHSHAVGTGRAELAMLLNEHLVSLKESPYEDQHEKQLQQEPQPVEADEGAIPTRIALICPPGWRTRLAATDSEWGVPDSGIGTPARHLGPYPHRYRRGLVRT